MIMSPARLCAGALLAGALALAASATGCQRSLFADSDPSTTWKLRRYYQNDSAVQTSEDRKKASDIGFGVPLGGGPQGPSGY
jgi:hypothetical protein